MVSGRATPKIAAAAMTSIVASETPASTVTTVSTNVAFNRSLAQPRARSTTSVTSG